MSAAATADGCSIENILENDLVSREIFAHLSLPDLLNISLVNTSWLNIVRCYIRENLICDRNLPKKPSPCTSLIALETDLESMAIPHYTGIRIHLKPCTAHSATNFSCDDQDFHLETMFPNILNRLNLKHIWLWLGMERNPQTCNLTVKLIRKLCQKSADSLRKITVVVKGYPDLAVVRSMLIGEGDADMTYTKVKTLCIDCGVFGQLKMEEFLHDLMKVLPKLEQVKCPHVTILPDGWKHLVKELVLDGIKSRCWDPRKFEATYNLEYFMATYCHFSPYRHPRYAPPDVFNNLLRSSAESLKTFSVRSTEFPKWSTSPKMPVLINVQKLEMFTSLESPWFLQEFGFICGVMCPGLKVVSVGQSPCIVGHILEPYEDQGRIVPNDRVKTLRLEGFDCDMDVMMGEFIKYFPNLTELHLVDCERLAIPVIFNWKTLKCIVFGGRNSYWTDNYDRFILGIESEEEMRELRKSWSSGHDLENFPTNKPGLLSLTDLRRVYVMGGAPPAGNGYEEEQVFLSEEVMSLVTKKMPQLGIRILKGYNDSILTHLVEFDNGAENPWCPPVPHDVEQYFEYSV